MMFPPSVPRFRICGEPIVETAEARNGAPDQMMSERINFACVASGPRTISRPSREISRSDSILEISTTTPGILAPGRRHSTRRSVPPARTRAAPPYSCNAATASRTEPGTI